MDEAIRARMKQALEIKGLNPYEVSLDAGLSRNYLWESFDPERRKGSINGYQKVAGKIGLNFIWLIQGVGEPFPTGQPTRQLDRELILAAIEIILQRLLQLDVAMAHDAAVRVLDIVERPPEDNSVTDTRDKIRIAVLGALRVFEKQSNQ
jgi:hypothetical protein